MNPSSSQSRDTGMAAVLAVLFADLFTDWNGSLLPAIILLALTMTWPNAFRQAAKAWFGFSHLVGGIASKILLSIIFFAVATPIGLLRRMTGADPMRLRLWKKSAGSVFIDRNAQVRPVDLEKPY